MPAYTAPTGDMLYALGELLGADGVLDELSGHAEISLSLMGEVLGEAGRFCAEIVQPLGR